MDPALPFVVDVSAAESVSFPDEIFFQDGLGDRVLVRDKQGRPAHESLLIRPELSSIPSFEFALNERLWLVEKFDHPGFLTVRNIVRYAGRVTTISLVNDATGGTRLSEVLTRAEAGGRPISAGAAVFLLREVLSSLADLHRHGGDLSHGALAAERIVLADGRVRIADYVLGPAIEQLRYSAERNWRELRVAVPSSAGGARLDRRADVAQAAMIAVAMFAGRPLRDAEHLAGMSDALMSISVPQPIRSWLLRALHMDPRRVFVHAGEGLQALNEAIAEAGLNPAPKDLEAAVGARITAVEAKPPAVAKPSTPSMPALKPQTPALKPAIVAAKPTRDIWQVHDVDPRGYVPQTAAARARGTPLSAGFKKFLGLATLIVLMTAAFTAAQFIPAPDWLFSNAGTLVIESNPIGVSVFVNGTAQGVTPLTLSVESGVHEVELRGPGKPRIFKVHVTRGDRVAQYIEFPQRR